MFTFSRKRDSITIDDQAINLAAPSEGEMEDYFDSLTNEDGETIRSKARRERIDIILLCVVDETGKRILNEGHVPEMLRWPFEVTQQIYQKCLPLCGRHKPKETLDDLKKKLEEILDCSLPTDWPKLLENSTSS